MDQVLVVVVVVALELAEWAHQRDPYVAWDIYGLRLGQLLGVASPGNVDIASSNRLAPERDHVLPATEGPQQPFPSTAALPRPPSTGWRMQRQICSPKT